MHPAFSVIFLTTLIGAGQGLFLALFSAELGARLGWLDPADAAFYVGGAVLVSGLMVLGLIASIFHLGRPERGWRAATRWRTSWLSREIIVLPLFVAGAVAYGAAHWILGTGRHAATAGVDTGHRCRHCPAVTGALRQHRDDLRLPEVPAGVGDAADSGQLSAAGLRLRLHTRNGLRRRRRTSAGTFLRG